MKEELEPKNEGKFTIVNDQNEELECEILFTFDSEETKKSYIVYTDNTTDEAGSTKVYASIYDPSCQDKSLKPIENESEWEVIENILASIQEKIDSEESGE